MRLTATTTSRGSKRRRKRIEQLRRPFPSADKTTRAAFTRRVSQKLSNDVDILDRDDRSRHSVPSSDRRREKVARSMIFVFSRQNVEDPRRSLARSVRWYERRIESQQNGSWPLPDCKQHNTKRNNKVRMETAANLVHGSIVHRHV